jgi:hypothetical protein
VNIREKETSTYDANGNRLTGVAEFDSDVDGTPDSRDISTPCLLQELQALHLDCHRRFDPAKA